MIPESAKKATNIEIPDTVRFIKSNALLRASSLKSISVPSSVVYIGNQAFYYCDSAIIEILNPNAYIGTNIVMYYGMTSDYKQYHTEPTIKGYKKSSAEACAKANSWKFITIK